MARSHRRLLMSCSFGYCGFLACLPGCISSSKFYSGIGIFLITDNVIHDSKRLVDHLQYHGITRVLFTPSLLQAVLELQGVDFKEKLKSVRQIWLHGEVVTTKLRDKLCHLLPWIQLLNLYRISECLDVAIAEASAEIDTDLSGKIVLVSEASSDIGAAIAEKLALCNAKVAMFAANFEQLENLKKKLQQAGACHVLAMKVDVTSSSEVKNAVEIIENCWGPVEILVDNGNCMYYQVMKNCDVAKWCKMEDVNGKGSLNCLAAVVGGMAERKSGRIVNITSDAGKVVMEKFDFSSSVETLNPSDVANAVVSALKQPFSCSILK